MDQILHRDNASSGPSLLDLGLHDCLSDPRQKGHQADATAHLPPELLTMIYEFGNMLAKEARSEHYKTHFPLVVS